jgi:hypothetical protein
MKTRAILFTTLAIFFLVFWSPCAQAGFVRQGGPVCTATGEQESPVLAPCPGGGAVIAWIDMRGDTNIYAQRIDGYGRTKWTLNGVDVCPNLHEQREASIASDGSGGAFIAWSDFRGADLDIYVQHVGAAGTLLWNSSGVAVCTAALDQTEPHILADGAGGCIVAWVDGRGGGAQGDIYAQRVRSNGAVSWKANGAVVSTANGYKNQLCMVSDMKGGAILAWSDYRFGGDMYAQKLRPNSSIAWAVGGVAVCAASNAQVNPAMVSDAKYGAIITWVDMRSSLLDVYAQRIDSLGSVKWAANGVGVCVDPGVQTDPKVSPDGEGGAFFAWIDQRDDNSDLYAGRVAPNGVLKWASNGIHICSSVNDVTELNMLPILRKSAGIIWADARDGATDIYAQGVDSTGDILLDPDGRVVCDTVGAQEYPTGVTDGANCAVLAWVDYRSSDADIYAARIDSNATFVATLLQSSEAKWTAGGVKIEWTLSEAGSGMRFSILRTPAGANDFAALGGADISSRGMAYSFIDRSALPGQSYVYRVDVSDEDGLRPLFETQAVSVPARPLALDQNSPNPFNPSTTIRFYLPDRCVARLDVFDAAGKIVRHLAGGVLEQGTHTVQWNGRDEAGNRVSSGVYFYKLRAGKESLSRKMVLVR